VTISSWLNFGRPAPPGRGSAAGWIFLDPPYYSQHAVFASLWVLFFITYCSLIDHRITSYTRWPVVYNIEKTWVAYYYYYYYYYYYTHYQDGVKYSTHQQKCNRNDYAMLPLDHGIRSHLWIGQSDADKQRCNLQLLAVLVQQLYWPIACHIIIIIIIISLPSSASHFNKTASLSYI